MKRTLLTLLGTWLVLPGVAIAGQGAAIHWINDIAWPILGLLIMLTCVFGAAYLMRRRSDRLAFQQGHAIRSVQQRRVARQRAISEPNWLAAYSESRRNRPVDDLTRIEGIGPKVCSVLLEQGITQYSQLARVPVGLIKRTLRSQGKPFSMIDPQSWPAQAALAANGQWDALQSMQKHLVGGRKRGATGKTLRVKCMSVSAG